LYNINIRTFFSSCTEDKSSTIKHFFDNKRKKDKTHKPKKINKRKTLVFALLQKKIAPEKIDRRAGFLFQTKNGK